VSVVERLGVADMERGLAEARELWQDWVATDRRLALAPAVDGLPDWLLSVNYDRADDVLHALVRIGSPSGGDCQAAVWVVVRALLPGAVGVARRASENPEADATYVRIRPEPSKPSPACKPVMDLVTTAPTTSTNRARAVPSSASWILINFGRLSGSGVLDVLVKCGEQPVSDVLGRRPHAHRSTGRRRDADDHADADAGADVPTPQLSRCTRHPARSAPA
jgi:hypothetical protein